MGFGKSSSIFGDDFGGPFSPLGGRGGGGGDGDGTDPRMAGLRGALIADVDDGGDGSGAGANDGQTGRVVSDSTRRPGGIVPVDDWGDTTDPRVLVATGGFIAGAQAAATAKQALQQL